MTTKEARDFMSGLFYEAWKETETLLGYLPVVHWQGVAEDKTPNVTEAWARYLIRHTGSRQATFGEKSNRRFTRSGIITIQVFAPIGVRGGGLTTAEQLSQIARDCYEGVQTGNDLMFRNAKIVEVGPTNGWYQYNVTIDFQYDEVK